MPKLTEELEALAFALFVSEYMSDPLDDVMSVWRSPDQRSTREKYRNKAYELEETLNFYGLNITSRIGVLKRFINTLITQPATTMYQIEDEAADKSPDTDPALLPPEPELHTQ